MVPLQVEKQFLYKYAVDIDTAITRHTFTCMRNAGYTTAFVRIYQPHGNGIVDIHALSNLENAHNAGLGVEVFVVPQPQGTKSGSVQFDEAYNFMKNNDITVNTMWIQITSPINWPNNQQANIAFIQDFMIRAKQYRVNVGLYTNWYDWQQITANWSKCSLQQLLLWYWNVYGQGPSAINASNFEDFRPFAGFTTPAVKQYSQGVSVCGAYVNQNVYSAVASQSTTSSTVNKTIIVGTIVGSLN
ncbi:unnamed protein product [Anisakis simplex]|uniref:GH25 family lysozyme M1 (1,4-beta-N-acetylmuramidase) n=1 Tax=Anisakis simplex TaxID=6269 RepID=A0A0M3JR82_ANISI|nr:unnamed protein product [Anisakis simplex]